MFSKLFMLGIVVTLVYGMSCGHVWAAEKPNPIVTIDMGDLRPLTLSFTLMWHQTPFVTSFI